MSKIIKEYIAIAKQLRYSASTIARIKDAKSEDEIIRIMHDARIGGM